MNTDAFDEKKFISVGTLPEVPAPCLFLAGMLHLAEEITTFLDIARNTDGYCFSDITSTEKYKKR